MDTFKPDRYGRLLKEDIEVIMKAVCKIAGTGQLFVTLSLMCLTHKRDYSDVSHNGPYFSMLDAPETSDTVIKILTSLWLNCYRASHLYHS